MHPAGKSLLFNSLKDSELNSINRKNNFKEVETERIKGFTSHNSNCSFDFPNLNFTKQTARPYSAKSESRHGCYFRIEMMN